MNTKGCIHPDLIRYLSLCSHGDKILIANGNYPLHSRTGTAAKVYLGLCEGVPTATQVLEVILNQLNVEAAHVMVPQDRPRPEIFAEYSRMLGGMELGELDRFGFYEECAGPQLIVAIHTGEKRSYSNLLLTVGGA